MRSSFLRPGQILMLALTTLLVVSKAQDVTDSPGKEKEAEPELLVLAESDFLWDDDNWTVRGNATDFQHSNRMVKAADDGPYEWYFVAPGKFLGAKRAAYGGKLSFKRGLYEYNSEGRDAQRDAFDVVLISEAYELVIGYPNVFPAWEFRSEHTLNLDETAGWILNSTGGPPSRPDMVRVFTKLSAIWIRGGIYYGHEDSYIMSVVLRAGPVDSAAPKATSLKKQKIHSPEVRPEDFEFTPPSPSTESESTSTETKSSSDEEDFRATSPNSKSGSSRAPPPPEDDEDAPPPPPASEDDDLPTLDSDLDDPPPKKEEKKKSGMFGGMFGSKKKNDEF